MPALPHIDDEVEVPRTTIAERDRRTVGRYARPVGCDEDIGAEICAVGFDDLADASRTVLFAGLYHELRVEAEMAALGDDGLQRQHVDRMLPLVVRRTAAIEVVSIHMDAPRRQPATPIRVVTQDHVTMAIPKYCRERWEEHTS